MRMTRDKLFGRHTPLTATGVALAAVLSGCGGASNNSGIIATPLSGPAVNGLSANDALGGTFIEVSGLASADATTAFLTGPVASTAKPSTVIAGGFNGTIPLGFAPDGSFGTTGNNIGTAVKTGTSVIFGASISNGNSTTAPIGINASSVVLTSPEVAGFSQKLNFTATNTQTGPLVAAQYTTAAFTLPFTTSGIHTLRASVGDQAGQSSTTDFDVVVVAPTDAAAYVQVQDADGNPITGATVSIDGADAPGYVGAGQTAPAAATSSVTDVNAVGIVFAVPGAATAEGGPTNTLTVTLPGSGGTYTQPITLTPGTATVAVAAPPAAAAAARPHAVARTKRH